VVIKDGEIQKQFDSTPGAKPTPFDLLHHMI
jgi:ribose transport system ATP-binding protein